MRYILLILCLFIFNPVSSITRYLVTENITIVNGENYNGLTLSGTYTKNLISKLGEDSTVITNLTVNTASIIPYGKTVTVNIEDRELYKQYLIYCNTMLDETTLIVGYKTALKTIQNTDGSITIQRTIVVNSRNNYNQYRIKTYKNIPSTETRIPVFSGSNTIHWISITYKVLQRKSGKDDFYANLYTLPIFGTVSTSIKKENVPYYLRYMVYCNKLVLDTIKIVGYKTIPLVPVKTSTGFVLTQNIVVNSKINYNQYRFKKYKNVPSTETRVPVLSSGRAIHWTSISYYTLQRKSTLIDFNTWYMNLLVKL